MRNFSLFILLLIGFSAFAQTEAVSTQRMKTDISYLASDQLEGRLTGSAGELKSSMYILDEFKKNNLKPLGDSGTFLQGFSIVRLRLNQSKAGIDFTEKSGRINHVIPLRGDFFPLAQSCNEASLKDVPVFNAGFGIQAPDLKHDDYANAGNLKGKVFVIKLGNPMSSQVHSAFQAFDGISYKVDLAIKMGAAGIVFVNADSSIKNPEGYLDRTITPRGIPVIFVKNKTQGLLNAETISFEVKIVQLNSTAHNVIGFVNNKRKTTVVIGAHQDHLGHNEYGGSRDINHADIHNGADDNASGVAMILEIMRNIKKSRKYKKHNYVFIAFSGEEQGLLGSNYFVKNPTFDTSKIVYMLNYDMVGRLDSSKKTLMLLGVGTSPVWKPAISKINQDTTQMKIKTSESGTGASDHTSFYYANIPVLHFFTGQHYDYHMPTDDEEKINYHGMFLVYNASMNLIKSLNRTKSFPFTPTKSEESEKMNFKVTLGIMPDYIYDGLGVRVDGVSLSKPADKAGLKKGDVITQLGDYKISTIQDYMQALGKFEKGQTTTVMVKRGEENLTFNLTF